MSVELPPVDLTECEREPIHVPEFVQSHGVLLVLDPESRRIERVSDNAEHLVGPRAPDLVGKPLDEVLPGPVVAAIAAVTQDAEAPRGAPPLVYAGDIGAQGGTHFEVLCHRFGDRVLVEAERVEPGDTAAAALGAARRAVRAIEQHDDLSGVADALARECRHLLGYDRVMVYRFEPEWHGAVIAEAREAHLEPFLGLHYPASDIPAQARALFLANRVRLFADVGAVPAAMVPAATSDADRVDMSFAALRGVSPVHVEYLRNMGVRATLSIALRRGEKLWGLIACHHYRGPRPLPYALRVAAELVGRAAELQIATIEARERADEAARTDSLVGAVAATLDDHEQLADGLSSCGDELLTLVDATGFAAWMGSSVIAHGHVPASSTLERIVAFLHSRTSREPFATHTLGAAVDLDEDDLRAAAGLVAIPLSRETGSWLLWFRGERRSTVTWAGVPTKAVERTSDGARLSPRKSFEAWNQQVEGESRRWSPLALDAVRALKSSLSDVLYRERTSLSSSNVMLAEKNEDLDAFASMASHDMREPLRAIALYARFLREDLEAEQHDDVESHLAAIDRLVRRMNNLIDALLQFARAGRERGRLSTVDADEVVAGLIEDLQANLDERSARVELMGPLPRVVGWDVGLREIFANLIGNALKYSESAPFIEIGTRPVEGCGGESGEPGALRDDSHVLFFVRDHGIGIPPEHHASIFSMFHRLHPAGQFGEGSGMGLAIAKRLVERLGGQIWVESRKGFGSTFYFTLPRGGAAS